MKAYQPKVEITLIKVVQRDRKRAKAATGPDSIIDLTPMLSEGSVVRFSRGVSQPAGVFSVDFPDRAASQSGDSLYSMIEPMDMIEIRMAREPHLYASLPVVFRGFVSSVKRSQKMGSDGKPQRRVAVSGRDWGGLMQAILVFYKKDFAIGKIMLNTFPMFTKFGVGFKNMTPAQFVTDIVEKIVNPWLADLRTAAKLEKELRLNVKASVTQGLVGPNGIQAHEGSIWDLLTKWTDLGWNELIMDDDNKGSTLIYRAKPYRDLKSGKLIMSDALGPEKTKQGAAAVVKLDAAAVVSIDVERNIDRVYNYFHVEAPLALLNSPDLINVQSMQNGSVFKTDIPNIDPVIYGIRKLSERTVMAATPGTSMHKTLAAKEAEKEKMETWLESRRDDLVNIRRDSAALETGNMVLRGDEKIKPGTYIELQHGNLNPQYYTQNVSHVFVVLGSYTTEIDFIRGTGFSERLKKPNYLQEYSRGTYG